MFPLLQTRETSCIGNYGPKIVLQSFYKVFEFITHVHVSHVLKFKLSYIHFKGDERGNWTRHEVVSVVAGDGGDCGDSDGSDGGDGGDDDVMRRRRRQICKKGSNI